MIITVEQAKTYCTGLKGWTNERIEQKLKAIEQTIRSFTNNNFQDREYRCTADVIGGVLCCSCKVPFAEGDTVMVSYGKNKGVFTVESVTENTFSVFENIVDESNLTVTKVVYPADVIDCCINMLEWGVNNRNKVGVKSETLSRHSVTYFDLDTSNQVMGYPVSLIGPLKPYKRMRC